MDERMLNATEVAMLVGCTVPTLTTWYKWKELHPEDSNAKLLPDFVRQGSEDRGQRMWRYSDIYKIIEFRQHIKRGRNGFLGEVTQKYTKKKGDSNDN